MPVIKSMSSIREVFIKKLVLRSLALKYANTHVLQRFITIA